MGRVLNFGQQNRRKVTSRPWSWNTPQEGGEEEAVCILRVLITWLLAGYKESSGKLWVIGVGRATRYRILDPWMTVDKIALFISPPITPQWTVMYVKNTLSWAIDSFMYMMQELSYSDEYVRLPHFLALFIPHVFVDICFSLFVVKGLNCNLFFILWRFLFMQLPLVAEGKGQEI